MSFMKKPAVRHPKLPVNDLGLTVRDYEGGMSTLCAGCGHDSITGALVEAAWGLSIPTHRFAKLSTPCKGHPRGSSPRAAALKLILRRVAVGWHPSKRCRLRAV